METEKVLQIRRTYMGRPEESKFFTAKVSYCRSNDDVVYAGGSVA